MRLLIAGLLTAIFPLGCVSSSDRQITPGDLIYERFPASETMLRVRAPCSVPSDDGGIYLLPPGDYKPISADSRGLFYEVSRAAEIQHGNQRVLLFDLGIYLPFSGRPSSPPYFWVEGVDLERGSVSRVKRWPLPDRCWRPYGPAMVVIHNGVEG